MYINTWFKASLGIFKILENRKIKTIVKLHNFRYFVPKIARTNVRIINLFAMHGIR